MRASADHPADGDLAGFYRGYIDCLNGQDWPALSRFVAEDVCRNGVFLGLSGYREMLVADFAAIPDLRFTVALLVCDPPLIASRLCFDCRPSGLLFSLPVNGRRVRFAENVFYQIRDGKIAEVWSVIDTEAIAAQIDAPEQR